MEQSGVCRTLVEREERDIRDARESFECVPDLTARIDSERS